MTDGIETMQAESPATASLLSHARRYSLSVASKGNPDCRDLENEATFMGQAPGEKCSAEIYYLAPLHKRKATARTDRRLDSGAISLAQWPGRVFFRAP
jgi:hypothetical protein